MGNRKTIETHKDVMITVREAKRIAKDWVEFERSNRQEMSSGIP